VSSRPALAKLGSPCPKNKIKTKVWGELPVALGSHTRTCWDLSWPLSCQAGLSCQLSPKDSSFGGRGRVRRLGEEVRWAVIQSITYYKEVGCVLCGRCRRGSAGTEPFLRLTVG
jgi:hypothetical protein